MGVGGVFLVLITLLNLFGVSEFGEFEFWFALIKIVAVIAMIAGGLWVIVANLPTDSGVRASSRLVHCGRRLLPARRHVARGRRPLGRLLMALVVVMFSFGGTELIGVTAGEVENPSKTIPRATNGIIWRILVFYVAALGIIMAVVPWDRIDGKMSPRADLRFRGRAGGRRNPQFRMPHRSDERIQLRTVFEFAHAVLARTPRQCAGHIWDA